MAKVVFAKKKSITKFTESKTMNKVRRLTKKLEKYEARKKYFDEYYKFQIENTKLELGYWKRQEEKHLDLYEEVRQK